MRQGPFEMTLVDETGSPFPEEEVGGVRYALARPNSSYHVELKVYPDARGRYPADCLRFGLYVDGQDVKYWKRIELSAARGPAKALFWGFKQSARQIGAFVISPEGSAAGGSIRAEVFGARPRPDCAVFQNITPLPHPLGHPSASARGPTAMGGAVGRDTFAPALPAWENTSSHPLAVLQLRYRSSGSSSSTPEEVEGRRAAKRPLSEVVAQAQGEEDDEVVIVEQPRHRVLPLLDLTNEEEDDNEGDNQGQGHRWTHIELPR